jgi:hypothetical protein
MRVRDSWRASCFDRYRSSTIVKEEYAIDRIDAGDLSPTSRVRNDWFPIPRVPSGGRTPSVTLGLYAFTCSAGSKAKHYAVNSPAGSKAEIYAVNSAADSKVEHSDARMPRNRWRVAWQLTRKASNSRSKGRDALFQLVSDVIWLIPLSKANGLAYRDRYFTGTCGVLSLSFKFK